VGITSGYKLGSTIFGFVPLSFRGSESIWKRGSTHVFKKFNFFVKN
jgi:hypothetical protein